MRYSFLPCILAALWSTSGEACGVVVAANQANGLDRDRDGVADSEDSCVATPAAVVVDSRGCSLEQRVPCAGPTGAKHGVWPDHATYAATVAQEAQRFVAQGRLDEAGRARAVQAAVRSRCGATH